MYTYAEYLKRENSIVALIELLDKLGIDSAYRKSRFGRLRAFSQGDMGKFCERMYNHGSEQSK